MEEFRKFLDELPIVLKIILALPFLDGIVYGIYRICKGTTAGIVLGVLWVFLGASVLWILDIVFLALGRPVFEL